MDYKQTLNITLSDRDPGAMPQRASLPAREPEIQRRWEEMDLYRLSLERRSPRGTFILHDGPPYSNGDIHLGHALNKIAKDIIVKFRSMQGFRAPYVPGWDNHGMPIENEVAREFRRRGESPDRAAMRRRCREYAAGFVEKQRAQFKRLGVRGDWDNPYLTMDPAFEARIVEVFGELAEKGCIYRGLKPVLWCAFCETALADAEVEYESHTSTSIYVRFPVVRDPNGVFQSERFGPANPYVLIWTTTPWTIPANLALAVHPDADYVVFDIHRERYLVAEPLLGRTLRAIYPPVSPDEPIAHEEGAERGEVYRYEGRVPPHGAAVPIEAHIVRRIKGSQLEGIVARHPLFDRESPVLMAGYVTMEDGTGVVHTAPGHGKEDFETGQQHGLEILCPVDPSGAFTRQAGEEFAGARILGGEADRRVVQALERAGHLLRHSPYEHSYPHCWRCHNPLLFRATIQWFMDIDHPLPRAEGEGSTGQAGDARPPATHREACLAAIQGVQWFPPVSINRIASMVASRPDWCLSRQRAWGVGIPAFYCRACGKAVLTPETVRAVRDAVARESSDVWYARTAAELLPPGFTCPDCGGADFEKETDILDVWFDSGSTHRAVLENPERWPGLRWPADVYLEGSDQHRGWFNSSLMIAIATKGAAPYRQVITNGFTVDENGRKMSKSLGNVVDPLKVMETYGADILRLWVASTNYFEDVSCSDAILEQVAGITLVNGRPQGTGGYWRIRNTFRFLVNNLYVGPSGGRRPFDPDADGVPYEQMEDLDRWALAQLDRLTAVCGAAYDVYEFHRVYHAVLEFCTVHMSAFYLDVIKDRLYCEAADSRLRRSALTALHRIAETMARILAPVLSHTAEEVWDLIRLPAKPPSAQLAPFPEPVPEQHREVLARWEPVMAVRDVAGQAVEAARQQKRIGNPLEARLEITADAATLPALQAQQDHLPAVFKVSQVTLRPGGQVSASAGPAEGTRCARCWLVKPDVPADPGLPDLCGRCAQVVSALAEPIAASPHNISGQRTR